MRPIPGRVLALAAAATFAIAGCASSTNEASSTGAGESLDTATATGTIQVASGRTYGVEQAFAQFTKDTGIKVEFTSGKDPELRERLAAEGDKSPVDVFLAVDAANLELAAQDGVLRSVNSSTLTNAVPDELRAKSNQWFGLSRRIRTIAYSTERVQPSELRGFAALGDAKWKGKLCLRSSAHPYNQSMVADWIATFGRDKASEIAKSWTANGPKVVNSDTEALEQIAAGACDVAVVNSYYIARLQNEKPGYPVAVHWAQDEGRGPTLNISGAGVTKASNNPAAALAFIEYLATGAGQRLFVDSNFEYPINTTTPPVQLLADWGPIAPPAETKPVREFGRLQPQAVLLLDEVGWR